MRKKLFATMIVAVVGVAASYNIYQSQNTNTLSDLALANVEALAASPEIGVGVICATTCSNCWCIYPDGYWADGEPYQ